MFRKVCFLFGSGASRPAKLPSVAEITQEILSGENLVWEKSKPIKLKTAAERLGGRMVLPRLCDESDDVRWNEHVRPMLLLLSWLKVQAERRYAAWPGREANYEDMAYLAGQLRDDFRDEYENPALTPFLEKALNELGDLLIDTTWSTSSKRDPKEVLQELTGKAVDYIRWGVTRLLEAPVAAENRAYMQLFFDAANDPCVAELNLFTLNHDTLVESFFKDGAKNIPLADGFTKEEDGVRCWDPSLFDAAGKVRLYKLHGAIDWRRIEPKQRNSQHSAHPWAEEFVGIQAGASSDTSATPRAFSSAVMPSSNRYTVLFEGLTSSFCLLRLDFFFMARMPPNNA